MESPASIARGRGRASGRKRHSFPVGPSSYPSSTATAGAEHVEQPPSLTTTDDIVSPSLSFETPSPTTSRGTRARVRVAEGTIPSSDDPDNKGGRSLRKRARVDYTSTWVDEYMSDGGKTTPSSVRTVKRRRTEAGFQEIDNEEEIGGPHIKRRSSEQLPPLASTLRKRNQARKSTLEPQPLIPNQQVEDVEVQDTIEVGGHQSEQSDESTLKRTSSNTSSGTSHDGSKPSHIVGSIDSLLTPQQSQTDLVQADPNTNELRKHAEQPKTAHALPPHASKSLAEKSSRPSYDHLTPYIEGAFLEWPLLQPEAELVSTSQPLHHDAAEETADDQADGARLDSFKADTAQEDTPMPDSLVPDSAPIDGATEDTPVLSPLPTDTRANSPVGDIGLPYNQPPTRKPIFFKKTRDASDFTSLFENHKSLSPEEVWARLEVVNRALVAWEAEYLELRKITDDEDNAARYRQDEISFLHRSKMIKSKDPNANPMRKEFVVKGIRAERPDPEITYVRLQDKLMATNYHFDYDEKETKIGYQDPVEQKTGYGKSRLRDRPKQTAKAAEADDVVTGPGKRVRKPVTLFDGGEVPSRGSSPIAPQRRRRRAGNTTEDNAEANLEPPPSADTAIEQAPPKKKGKGGRPRKHPLPVPIAEDTPAPAEAVPPQPTQPEEGKPTRKRRRRKTIVEPAEEEEATASNDVDQQVPVKAEPRRISSRLPEIPAGSFYTSSMQSTNAADESRPPTSSSTATQSSMASKNNSNYQLREKRQKKFSLNPDDEVYDDEPKPKRVRRSKKTQVVDPKATAVPAPITSPPPVQQQQQQQAKVPESLPAPKPPTKIKLKNYNGYVSAPLPIPVPATNPFSVPSSSSSTPPHNGNGASNGAMNGTDPADIKDYNQMTKSEKMSHSMKARWASGSMSQAVAKRRATLANKKQAVKTVEPAQPLEIPTVLTQP